ncbi:MAG: bifunctional diaminohydroxyphosphoribosylaminopyrimidine deaminase/5-amino-6-(5-phosphoribosylamino)uracil reductase RibD [Bacteroidetes bacterium]|nr:bifunctional diaminohydroxyphosphoribosylaminopyrimidine deaminase/5-amino-6-(5-phosphoribosylamino)uracil reductase RibD [Bacteroidota bacterium]
MRRCLELASNGLGRTAPNPMVGAVIVYNGKIIGEGYHRHYGGLHAEAEAINAVEKKDLLSMSTLYVNLEPCSHFGKTPPCTDLIVRMKIPNVVTGCRDSNMKVTGKGIEKLRSAGCKVYEGVLEHDCRHLNRRFFTFHEKKRPYIILKWAQSRDGFIDTARKTNAPARPNWITSDAVRTLVHKWRAEEQAIMVGTNTAEKDNPILNVRNWDGKNPLRIVTDRILRLPADINLFDGTIPTVVYTALNRRSKKNLEFVRVDFGGNLLSSILDDLYSREIQSVIIEGGSLLLGSFLRDDLWDEARIFTGMTYFLSGVISPEISGKTVFTEYIGNSRLDVIVPADSSTGTCR